MLKSLKKISLAAVQNAYERIENTAENTPYYNGRLYAGALLVASIGKLFGITKNSIATTSCKDNTR